VYNRLHYYKWDFYVKGACEDMAQHKKDYITLNIKMDTALMRRFATYCKDVGQTKTLAVERIIGAFLDERGAKAEKERKEAENL